MKVCTKCKVEKDEDLFFRNKSNKSGRNPWCKQCASEYYIKNKDSIAKYKKEYGIKNKDKIKKYLEEYKANNIDDIRKRNNISTKRYYLKNRDKVKKRESEYRAKNKDKLKEYAAKRAGELKYTYVARLIAGHGSTLRAESIPEVLIEAKRMQIMINRKIKEMTK